MTTRIVHRPARTVHPPTGSGNRRVEAPPTLPEGQGGGNGLLSILPMVGMMGSLTMMMVLRNPAFMGIGAVMLVLAVFAGAAMLLSRRGQLGRQRRAQRERYLDYLEELREELGRAERETRVRARLLDPPPEALYDVVRDPTRLWERRRQHEDFLRVRIGTGSMPGDPLTLGEKGSALAPADPFMASEARALIRRYETMPDMPLTVPLDVAGNVSVIGARPDVIRLMRAFLLQLAVFHAPADVGVAVAYAGARAGDWGWLKWLPHVLDEQRRDGTVHARLIAPTPLRLGALLADDLRQRGDIATEIRRGMSKREALRQVRRLVAVHDTHGEVASELHRPDEALAPQELALTVIHLVADQVDEPSEVSVRMTVSADKVVVEDLRGETPVTLTGSVDDVSGPAMSGFARMLAPLRLSRESLEEEAHAGNVDFIGLMNVEDPGGLDVPKLWAPRTERNFLRVPIGIDDMGEPVVLDLKESAELGMGPHGLCVGATGSGKSEMLRALVLALAASHPPDRVSMMLVDYKGGATFAPYARLPHVAGVITNLEDDAGLIERVYASLAGEVQRRQQVLKDAGNIANIGDYTYRRRHDPGLPPLPHLLVIIDEFGELLTARPDFIELFLSIGRIGRSIGVHLLLSSQRIEGGKLRGLDSYLSYRLGLRTFSEEESRTILDTPDAFHLPAPPGFGYLKVDTTIYQRFKGGYVSGPYRGPTAVAADGDAPVTVTPYPAYNTLSAQQVVADDDAGADLPERTVGPTLLDVMVDQLRRHGERAQTIWLPPLPTVTTLDALAGPVRVTGDGMWLPVEPARLNVPIGVLDDPRRQWQGMWNLDLTAAGGHAAVIGGPQTGKTTLLRTLVLSLALTHTPAQAAVYAIDLVGGGLQVLGGLPGVGGVAGRADRERVRRTVEEVHRMLDVRQEVFRTRGIDSLHHLRAMHAADRLPELPSADVVLVIDGFGAIRNDFEEVDDMIGDLLQRGGGYGIHVVAGMLRWNDVRMAMQSNFGQRIELRLNDPTDSTIDRKLAETISAKEPGRALTDGKLFAQVALPRIDAKPETADLGAMVEKTVRTISGAWHGPVASPVRVLPGELAPSAVPAVDAEARRVPIGIDERGFDAVLLDLFDRDQNLVVLGDGECGKTNLVRVITRGLVERYSEEEVVFAVMDPRRGLRGVVPDPYLGGYASNSRVCAGLAAGVAKELADRMPDEGDQSELETRFDGPRVVVLVDDYDLLTAAGQQPLAPFLPFVSVGRDIGLHFVVTRRVAGASRGLYDPLIQAIREIGTSALVMSGDRSEGQLFPQVYAAQRPPGRGTWIRRGGSARLIQTVLLETAPESGGNA